MQYHFSVLEIFHTSYSIPSITATGLWDTHTNCHSLIRAKGSACSLPLAECVCINDSHHCQTICNRLIEILLLLSDPAFIPFLDPSRPRCHLSCDLLNESPDFDLNVDCLCCHFGEWITASPTSDLSCLLSDEVRRFVLPCSLCKSDFDHGWCICACCSLGCLIKGSNSVLVLDNAHSTICVLSCTASNKSLFD